MYRKEIVWDRETHDFAMYLDSELVGFARTPDEANATLDQLVFELISGAHFAEAHARPAEVVELVEVHSCPDCGEPWDRTLCLACGWQALPLVLARPKEEPALIEVPTAYARYAGIGSPASGARRIIVDSCPYCGGMHSHLESFGGSGQRMADCFRGEYILSFEKPDIHARPAEVSAPIYVTLATCDICEEVKPKTAFVLNSGPFAPDCIACDDCVTLLGTKLPDLLGMTAEARERALDAAVERVRWKIARDAYEATLTNDPNPELDPDYLAFVSEPAGPTCGICAQPGPFLLNSGPYAAELTVCDDCVRGFGGEPSAAVVDGTPLAKAVACLLRGDRHPVNVEIVKRAAESRRACLTEVADKAPRLLTEPDFAAMQAELQAFDAFLALPAAPRAAEDTISPVAPDTSHAAGRMPQPEAASPPDQAYLDALDGVGPWPATPDTLVCPKCRVNPADPSSLGHICVACGIVAAEKFIAYANALYRCPECGDPVEADGQQCRACQEDMGIAPDILRRRALALINDWAESSFADPELDAAFAAVHRALLYPTPVTNGESLMAAFRDAPDVFLTKFDSFGSKVQTVMTRSAAQYLGCDIADIDALWVETRMKLALV